MGKKSSSQSFLIINDQNIITESLFCDLKLRGCMHVFNILHQKKTGYPLIYPDKSNPTIQTKHPTIGIYLK